MRPVPASPPGLDVQAHRGGAGLWPENTLEAYVPFTTGDLVADAHAAGLRVVPSVVDDPPTMRSLIDAGVDGLITNRPDVLREVLAAAGHAVPPAFPGS